MSDKLKSADGRSVVDVSPIEPLFGHEWNGLLKPISEELPFPTVHEAQPRKLQPIGLQIIPEAVSSPFLIERQRSTVTLSLDCLIRDDADDMDLDFKFIFELFNAASSHLNIIHTTHSLLTTVTVVLFWSFF